MCHFYVLFWNMQMWLNLLMHLYFTLKYHSYECTWLITSMSVDLPFLCILACSDRSANHALLVVLTWEYVARHVLLCLFTWYCRQWNIYQIRRINLGICNLTCHSLVSLPGSIEQWNIYWICKITCYCCILNISCVPTC